MRTLSIPRPCRPSPRRWRAKAADTTNLRSALRGEEESRERTFVEGVLPERVLVVGLGRKSSRQEGSYTLQESLAELKSLAETAGLDVVEEVCQFVDAPNPATYVGSGKLAQIATIVEDAAISTVVFDEELSPAQLTNLENTLGADVRICDRTALTLDIFSQRALSKEGKLQVALAQCQYQLPRLTRMWTHLERQVAGAGGSNAVKGMGEKQIEVDKRLLRHRMATIKHDLDEVKLHRRLQRSRRAEQDLPVVTLVGYTNAGKSTLLNALTDAGVFVEDKLFATLDPTTRRLKLPSGKVALMTDTVGFIQKLPPQLVAAFSATLEELLDSSLLLHVVDASHPQAQKQRRAVEEVLESLGAQALPILTVWNKSDVLPRKDKEALVTGEREVCVSAAKGEGLGELLVAIERIVEESMVPLTVQIPYANGELVQRVYDHGVVRKAKHDGEGTRLAASVPLYLAMQLKPFQVASV